MANVHTSIVNEAHQILFYCLPKGTAMPRSGRGVLETQLRSILYAHIILKCRNDSHRKNFQPNSQSYYTKSNFDRGSRGVHRSDKICAKRLQFCTLACFLADYNRLWRTESGLPSKCTCYSLPSQVFSKRRHSNH